MSSDRNLLSLSRSIYFDEGTRKPDHYFRIYDRYLADLRSQNFCLLELGVFSGASALLWRDYFPKAEIVCLDITDPPARLNAAIDEGSIKFVQGDQSDPRILAKTTEATGGRQFDVIIDDASHVGSLSRSSFEFLFRHSLIPGGRYFIEDYGTGYDSSFYDGAPFSRPPWSKNDKVFPSVQAGMVGFAKQLVDELHAFAMSDPGDPFLIESVQFWHSVLLVRKLSGDQDTFPMR